MTGIGVKADRQLLSFPGVGLLSYTHESATKTTSRSFSVSISDRGTITDMLEVQRFAFRG
jgi:hypothetical protein